MTALFFVIYFFSFAKKKIYLMAESNFVNKKKILPYGRK